MLHRSEHRLGLGHLPVSEEEAGEGDSRRDVVGVGLDRGSQGGRIAGGDQLLGGGGGGGVEETIHHHARLGADELGDHRSVAEGLDRGDAADPVAGRQAGVGVGVDLGEGDGSAARRNGVLQDRPELPAGSAPCGPEVDDDGRAAGAVKDVGGERALGDIHSHVHGVPAARPINASAGTSARRLPCRAPSFSPSRSLAGWSGGVRAGARTGRGAVGYELAVAELEMSSVPAQVSRNRSESTAAAGAADTVCSSTARRGSSQSWQMIQIAPGSPTALSRRWRRPHSSQVMVMRIWVLRASPLWAPRLVATPLRRRQRCTGPAQDAITTG